MSLVDRLWIRHIKSSQPAHSDFFAWIGEEIDKVRDEYKKASTYEEFQSIKAQELALDKIRRIFTMQDREEISVAVLKRG